MTRKIGVGPADFEQLRQQDIYFVDKTHLIQQLLEEPAQVLLFPRPRRFGKTLAQSMLRCFLEKSDQDRSGLFQDLTVWRSERARLHFGRYPVVSLSFKDVRTESPETFLKAMRMLLADVHLQHSYLLEQGDLHPAEQARFRSMIDGTASDELCGMSLKYLTGQLARHHGEQAVVLIDEYDAPLHRAYDSPSFDKVLSFLRTLFSATLKDNRYLFKGVLTGILHIARENLLSDLNNITVNSILSHYYSEAFGFTDAEVRELAAELGQPELHEQIASWYNGYRFGTTTIYNPWSVLSFAQNPRNGFKPYWVFTSSDDILRPLVFERQATVVSGMETLLRGEALTRTVSEQLILRDIDRDEDALWNLLLHSGYLTARDIRDEAGHTVVDLALPNREMSFVFERSIRSWLEYGLENSPENVTALLRSMLEGEEEDFGTLLDLLVRRTFSYHDTAGPRPERVYQAFLLGLLVYLSETHEVRSDRESGLGRYDVMIAPRRAGQPGVVLECKRLRKNETVEQALDSALEQIRAKGYTTELAARGASPVRTYALVFDGKQVWVRLGERPRARKAASPRQRRRKSAPGEGKNS